MSACGVLEASNVLNLFWGGGSTLFLSVDFVNILPKKGGGQTLIFTKALTKF